MHSCRRWWSKSDHRIMLELRLRARKAVVSNADLHNTFKLVPKGKHEAFDAEREGGRWTGTSLQLKTSATKHCPALAARTRSA